MGSFAVNRKEMNKGRGIRPGVWDFEEFMYSDSVFGMATVGYTCSARKLTKSEVAQEDTGKPYELEITDPWIRHIEIHDDNGDEIDGLLLTKEQYAEAARIILEAFEDVKEAVIDFEMGLL